MKSRLPDTDFAHVSQNPFFAPDASIIEQLEAYMEIGRAHV